MDSAGRQKLLMDKGWRFHPGEPARERLRGHGATYEATKAGGAPGPANPRWDDSAWRVVDLPHDFAVEQPFDPDAVPNQGFRPRGTAWYRRRFRLDPSLEGKWLCLEIGAVATNCTVYLNGTVVARHHGGYAPFLVDVTPVALFGEAANTLAVHVDADAFEGWWYEGAGIYRHVWLHAADTLHAAIWGTFAEPVKLDATRWDTRIRTDVESASKAERQATVRSTVLGPDGRVLGTAQSELRVPAFGRATAAHSVSVEGPALWRLESPALHLLRTEILSGGAVVDATETRFGYRSIRFDADRGFFLNGQAVKLKGTCNHQDHAGVGVAVPDSIQEWRIRRLKEMGSNAYRCAHNPPAEELLDACDRLGMLVMDEHRAFAPDRDAMADLRTMVSRDRNHPSVVLWSMFNEEFLAQNTPAGRRIVERMIALTRSLDPSRPITAAINSSRVEEAGVAPALDVIGINYSQESYDPTHARFPRIPLVSSENTCVYATRGEDRTDRGGMRWDNYDVEHTPFGDTARRTWKLIAERPFVAGCFVWTGFDYRGEPQPDNWPCASAHLGIIDTCGFAKDGFHLYRAMWTDEPVLHLFPHWSRHGMEGEPVRLMCYTNCDEVELYLDGRSLGRRKASPFEPPEWSVPWAPGELRAEGRRAGKPAAPDVLRTAGAPVRVRVSADRARLDADGEDAVPVAAWVEDAAGIAVPTASNRIDFSVAGPARVIGVGNGDPLCHEPDRASSRSLFNGLCQAILQSSGAPGRAVLTASSPGLEPARLALECGGRGPRPAVAAL